MFSMRKRCLQWLAAAALVLGITSMVSAEWVFAEEDICWLSNINNGAGTKVADYLEKAREEGKSILYMTNPPRGTVGDVNFTAHFKEFSYKKRNGEDDINYLGKIKQADIGWMDKDVITFEQGTNITVKNINFYKRRAYDQGAYVVIEEGATVRFSNVSFSNTVVNNGEAIFENVTFVTGEIENNGSATYLGDTTEPKNIGTPKEIQGGNDANTPDAGTDPDDQNADQNSGQNTDQDDASQGTQTALEVKIDGKIPGYAVGEDASEVDTISGATGAGGSIIQTEEGLKLQIKEEDGKFVDYFDYARTHLGAQIRATYEITPEGSGLSAIEILGSIRMTGTAGNAGRYALTAKVTDGERTAISNAVAFEIYDMNISFKDRLAMLNSDTKYWLMAPHFIKNTDGGATIPNNIKKIYGSNEHGLYGIIGNENAGANWGKDVITIPRGADLTFTNMKLFSSVKLVVEEGAKLTLDGSVAHCPIEVNGGTLKIMENSSVTHGIVLNEGSVLEDSYIKSFSMSLTDGNKAIENTADTVVTVNGDVTFKGQNTVLASYGDAQHKGQTGLKINQATVTLEQGGILNVAGGGTRTEIFAPNGGDAIALREGHIVGRSATLQVRGGTGHNTLGNGSGGHGVAGEGSLDISVIKAAGGMGYSEHSVLYGYGKGGDSIQRSVRILNQENTDLEAIGGKGEPNGISYQKVEPGKSSEPADNDVQETPTEENVSDDTKDAKETNDSGNTENNLPSTDSNIQSGASDHKAENSGSGGGASGTSASRRASGSGNGSSAEAATKQKSVEAALPSKEVSIPEGSVPLSQPQATVMTKSFTDVSDTHWAKAVIKRSVEKGYFAGTSPTTFSPNGVLTRAEFITVLGRLLKAEYTGEKSLYSDVKPESYYYTSVNWAKVVGYMNGMGESFHPTAKITREQASAVLANVIRAYGAPSNAADISFSDDAKISPWAKESVSIVRNAKLINGYANGNFGAKDAITRAQMAQIILNLETYLDNLA